MADPSGLIVIALVFFLPVLFLASAFWYWTDKKSRHAILYWDGTGYTKYDRKVKDGKVNIKKTEHIVDGIEAITYKGAFYSPKQLCFMIHKDKIKAIDLKKFADRGTIDGITPAALKVLLEGADIKSVHSVLRKMDSFSFTNPLFIAGIGVGAAIGIILMLTFYKPDVPIKVVEVAKETAPPMMRVAFMWLGGL